MERTGTGTGTGIWQTIELDEPPARGSGHVTRWPAAAAIHTSGRDTRLAYMESDGAIMAEDGEHWIPRSWDEFAELMTSANLLLFTGPIELALREWIFDARDETHATRKARGRWVEWFWNRQTNRLAGVTLHVLAPARNGKLRWQSRHIRCASSWAGRVPDMELLGDIRAVSTTLGEVPAPSPGSLGTGALLSVWRGQDRRDRHSRPQLQLVLDLAQHSPGGFKYTSDPDTVYEEAYELDRRNGYAAECRELPAGTAHGPYSGRFALELATGYCLGSHSDYHVSAFFGHFLVFVSGSGLPVGDLAPFLVENKVDGSLIAPTQPGLYDAWLWHFDVAAILQRQAEETPIELVSVDHLWCWPEMTRELWPWQQLMDDARAHFDRRGEPHRAQLVKACIVAAIGRLGMPYVDTRVMEDDPEQWLDCAPPPGVQVVYSELQPRLTFALQTTFNDHGAPIHWHRYILARQNASILAEWHREYMAGTQPVAANIDALVTAHHPVGGVRPIDADTGDYRRRSLGAYFASPAPGVMLSPVIGAKTPGLSKDDQKRITKGRVWHGRRRASPGDLSVTALAVPGEVDRWAMHPSARIRTLEALRRWYRRKDPA